jgi:hypothetical protein
MRPGRLLGRHWRGELPLRLGFWGLLVLPVGLAGLAVGALTTWISLGGGGLRASSAALLAAWPLLLALTVFGSVGLWRATSAHRDPGSARRWAMAARVAGVSMVAATLATGVLSFGPRAGRYAQLVRGIDPGGQLVAKLSDDGRRLSLKGPLGLGDAARLRQRLDAAPALHLVELESTGGHLDEATGIADALRARRVQVRAVGTCANTCALVFMAGASRQVTPDARLGFQRLASGSFNPLFGMLANRELAAAYRRAGLPQTFITKMLSTPPSWLWSPDFDELAAAGVISVPAHPLDIDLAAAAGAQALDHADALHTNPTWHALDRRYPGTIAAAAELMQAARSAAATDEATLVAGQRVVEALLPKLLARASPALREQFIVLLGEQLAAHQATGASSCQALLAGDAALRRGLPATLARRESEWLKDAASESAPDTAPRPPGPLEVEVVRRTLGERAPARLADLWHGAAADTQTCVRAAELVKAILAMPPPERKLAIKLVFSRLQ